MAVLFTFLLLLVVFYAMLWGGSLILQSYFYSVPVDGLAWRAAVGAATVALFLTIWFALDRRDPGKFDTFLDFVAYDIVEIDTFDAVRVSPAGIEKTVTYTRPTRLRRAAEYRPNDYKDSKGIAFNRSDTDSMVMAIVVKMPTTGESVRFEAVNVNKVDAKTGTKKIVFNNPQPYNEVRGSRTMTDQTVGKVIVPKNGLLFANLALNLAQYLIWFAVFYPILRYELWHSIGGALIFGLATMLIGIPILLGPNRNGSTPTPPPVAATIAETAAIPIAPAK